MCGTRVVPDKVRQTFSLFEVSHTGRVVCSKWETAHSHTHTHTHTHLNDQARAQEEKRGIDVGVRESKRERV